MLDKNFGVNDDQEGFEVSSLAVTSNMVNRHDISPNIVKDEESAE